MFLGWLWGPVIRFVFLPNNSSSSYGVKMSYRYSVTCHVSRVLSSLRCAPALTVGNQPLERDVDIVFLLATDAVTADLTVLDRVQIHLLYQTVFIQGSCKVKS